MLRQIRHRLAAYQLRRISSTNIRRRRTVALKEAGDILVLMTDPAHADPATTEFVRQLRAGGSRVRMVCFFRQGIPPALSNDVVCFGKKDINWYYNPKSPEVLDLIKQPYDIIFDLSMEDCWPLLFLLAMSNSYMRVGILSEMKKPYLDLMIDAGSLQGLKPFVEAINHYMNLITSRP